MRKPPRRSPGTYSRRPASARAPKGCETRTGHGTLQANQAGINITGRGMRKSVSTRTALLLPRPACLHARYIGTWGWRGGLSGLAVGPPLRMCISTRQPERMYVRDSGRDPSKVGSSLTPCCVFRPDWCLPRPFQMRYFRSPALGHHVIPCDIHRHRDICISDIHFFCADIRPSPAGTHP